MKNSLSTKWRSVVAVTALLGAGVFMATTARGAWAHAFTTSQTGGPALRSVDIIFASMLAVHVLAAVAWIGGLTFMFLVVPHLIGFAAGKDRPALALQLYRKAYDRFGVIAGYSVLILVASGVYNSVFNAPNERGIFNFAGLLQQPLGSAWGGVLLAKIVIVALMIGVAAFMRFRVVPLLGAASASPSGSRNAGPRKRKRDSPFANLH